jgi:hypothetical protein
MGGYRGIGLACASSYPSFQSIMTIIKTCFNILKKKLHNGLKYSCSFTCAVVDINTFVGYMGAATFLGG